MATEDMEVTIKLTPLGRDEGENHRTIKMNNDHDEVKIGRASKNLHKGLNAACDNAWFDYPILSRAHAKFTLAISRKVLYIQDSGSTHGTYLHGKRLEEGVEHTLHDGEIITFGQRVTSGAVTYPAKQFRVYSQWEPRIPAAMARLFSKKPTSRFEVPDESNDSSSEQSREASIQILDSHPRTFSVPSTESGSDSEESDVESVEIASSVREEGQKNSTVETPNDGNGAKNAISIDVEEGLHHDLPQRKVQGLNLKGPSISNVLSKSDLGKSTTMNGSEQSAINLEKEDSNVLRLDDETDDEVPEELPIQQNPPKMDTNPTWNEPKPLRQQYPLPTVTDYEADLDTEDQVERLIVETQARAARRNSEKITQTQSPELLSESAVGATDGFDSTDDDGFGHDDDFSSYGREDMSMDPFKNIDLDTVPLGEEVYPLISTSSLEITKPEAIHKEPSVQKQSSPKPLCPNLSVSDNNGVSKATCTEFPRYRSTLQRAPSPSDAALARNLSPVLHDSNISSNYYTRRSNIYDQNDYGMQTCNGSNMNQGTLSNAPVGYEAVRPISYPELPGQDAQCRPYNQGPFVNPYQALTAPGFHQWVPAGGSYDRVGGPYVDPLAVDSSYPSHQDVAADARYAAKLQAEEDAYASTAHAFHKAKQTLAVCPESQKGTEGQSSKINIASLVNASHMENARPLKRKAGDISTSTHDEESQIKPMSITSTVLSNDQEHKAPILPASHGVDETQLPDAQPRSVPVDIASLTQDSSFEPNDLPASTSRMTQAGEVEGPPQKKARTSSSSSKGIGKFVSGVCVGLVGAFAAFVATIPASVREEALREMANAA